MKLMNLQKNIYYDLKFIMNSRNVKKKSKFRTFKVMKLMFKIILVNCFYTSLSMIGFVDLILIFYI